MNWLALKLWISTPIGRFLGGVAAIVIAAAALVAGGLALRAHWISVGVDQEKADQAARLAKAGKKVAKVEAQGAVITANLAGQLEATRTEIRWRTRVQLQEVTRYVPVESDRACVVGVGALRLHDHALAGLSGLSEPAGGSVQADSGVPFSALLADDVAFAGVAYDWRAEALTWRAWYDEHQALWSTQIKATDPPP
jgi:hypothetical protein